ncbi:interferon lambda receptor 1 isoform X2 [Otolemur garnettii]|uniref:interferon lambda receptor 1 isoform X2 n=1 Tax=Otolemur garnettii TaxID=30611 RepID=UPI00027422E4|nr:interferon lambda receptor 1 isoform X2 [Otolemur garnettii]
MAGTGRWAPLFLCLLQAAPGRPRLAPPQNVTLLSQNFSVYLTWLPGPGNPQDVTYFVAYQSFATPKRWRRVKNCAGTQELVCSMMCLKKQDLYNKFKGRVQATSPSARSPWVESKYLDYLFDVNPAPPVLVVNLTEEMVRATATYQLPPCVPPPDLNYEVAFWKEGARNKTLFPVAPYGQPVHIPLQPATSERHCLSARTIYTLIVSKYSEFSKPTCFLVGAPGPNWTLLGLPPLLPGLIAIVIGVMIWKSLMKNPWFQLEKTPQALELAGRARVTSRVRAPATLQTGSEKDGDENQEEDEEDSEGSVTLQPYIEPPPFLGQGHWVPGCSKVQGVDSGRPWAPLVQGKGSSAWDSSDQSWASTADSSLWDEAGSSGCLTRKGPDREPREDRHGEALPPSEFSKDSGYLEELPEDALSSWATWGSSSPVLDLVPGDPPVSLWSLTLKWDSSSPKEEEEEEEDDEGGRESEVDDSSADTLETESILRTKERMLGHYVAR